LINFSDFTMASSFQSLSRVGLAVLNGEMSSRQAVQICLDRIEQQTGPGRSFVNLRAEQALAESLERDAEPARGPLHGIPFAVKDIFDTAEMPTEVSSRNYEGFQPAKDAAAVSLLRASGAVLLGKVATVEFRSANAPSKIPNPSSEEFTPGGSSAGSGAAVGAGLVPLALSTQTGGSTIRPASFCGAAAFKPTWGRVPVEGMKPFAPSLDTVGWVAEDCELLFRSARASGIDEKDPAINGRPLRIGFYETPYFSEAEEETHVALEETIRLLEDAGHRVEVVLGPAGCDRLNEWQDILMHGEGRASYLVEQARDTDAVHPGVLGVVSTEQGFTHEGMTEAYDHIAALRPRFDAALEPFDAWLTPAVVGEPPHQEKGNRLATFNRLFTALGLPCAGLPGLTGPYGLPVGIQLLAPRFADVHLLAVAKIVQGLIYQD
jgi:Asp-tRNA(Asn)/Glu-tRNA(Gln) amidotransferase A subunit family amidase